ncbi:CDC53_1 [Sanghuangporus vaninii]
MDMEDPRRNLRTCSFSKTYWFKELRRLLGLLKENDDLGVGEVARTGSNLTGVNLYNEITRYLVSQLKIVREANAESLFDENLVRYYAKEWDRYTINADYINRSFTYLNRYWVQREEDVREKGAYTFNSHYKSGRDIIDQILVKKVVDSFVSLGIDERDSNTHSLDVYKDHFETLFIAATESYYKQESTNFLSANSVSDYLKRAEERLKEEEDRVDRYLHAITRKTLVATCEHVLIREHAETINDEESIDTKAYVDALLEMHKRSSETVDRSFRGEVGFVASLDEACREFINRNAIAGSSSGRSSEVFVKQADALLRKNNKMSEEGSLESALDKVVYLHLEMFVGTLHPTDSITVESESSMVSKLKEACGFEYTQKLQQMFTDMSLSKDLTDSFKEKMVVSHGGITFIIQVLGTNVWPLRPLVMNFVIPKEISPTYNRFQQYHQQKHSGRRLTWLWVYGKNELHSNYTSQKRIFLTSSFKIAVLVLYNDCDSLSFREIQANTGFREDLLKQVLSVLCKARVLYDGKGKSYDLNMNCKSKRIRVDLNQPIRLAEKAESIEVLENADEDRKLGLQATIVRIMKSRKTTKNQELIQEVISHVSAKFTPNISEIKDAIDVLLKQEYIKRSDSARDISAYVARCFFALRIILSPSLYSCLEIPSMDEITFMNHDM